MEEKKNMERAGPSSPDHGCSCCGAKEESEMHALLECAAAEEVWLRVAYLRVLDEDVWRSFLAVLWAVWNVRNKTTFGDLNDQWAMAGRKTIIFCDYFTRANYGEATNSSAKSSLVPLWQPPIAGTWKLNVDVARHGEKGAAWGFTIGDHVAEVVAAGYKVGDCWGGADYEEARGLYWGLKVAWECGYRRLIAEGDCLAVLSKVKRRELSTSSAMP
ncbi:hypothetical protein RDABS01_003991 [Bienertia sinuspersici]